MKIKKEIIGNIKELHGVNCAPYVASCGKEQFIIRQLFGYCGIPRSRTHDVNGAYGGSYFIDVPNIFRDFNADENDEKNFDFYYTDEYLTAIIKTGAQIVYRLGVTIEWGSKKYAANPPANFAKWARICEHIIMHYNKGWANGFKYNIEYWEIWNEPENPPMWTGNKKQFLELYKVTSKYLKAKFPEIKLGGYGSCGMYSVFRLETSAFFKGVLTWFEDFLSMCKRENCPLDFFSWHIYTLKVDEIIKSAEYVRKKLDEYGFNKTESHLNEWNYGAEGGGFDNLSSMTGAGFIASAFIAMQNSSIDKAMYYCLNSTSGYNGFWNTRTKELTPVAHLYRVFSILFKEGKQLAIETQNHEPTVLAVNCKGKTMVLISTYAQTQKTFKIEIENAKGTGKIYRLSDKYGFTFDKEFNASDDWIYCAPKTVYLLEIANDK